MTGGKVCYMTTTTTDSIRLLANRHNTTPTAIRATAHDLGLNLAYSPSRHTYYINEPATTVARFNQHLAEMAR